MAFPSARRVLLLRRRGGESGQAAAVGGQQQGERGRLRTPIGGGTRGCASGDRAEVEEAPTTAVSVRQQGTLDADKTDAPPATEDVSRLAGFGQISGKKNSLDKKASRPSQGSSVTGQTGAKDKESEEDGSVDL